jgi:hypothetical protein
MKADRLKRRGSSRQRGWPVAERLSQAGTGLFPAHAGTRLPRPPSITPPRYGEGAASHLKASSLAVMLHRTGWFPPGEGMTSQSPPAAQPSLLCVLASRLNGLS